MTCRLTASESGNSRVSLVSTLKKFGPIPALRPSPERAVGVGVAVAERIEAGRQVVWRERVRRHDSRQGEIRQQVVSEATPTCGLPRGLGHDVGDETVPAMIGGEGPFVTGVPRDVRLVGRIVVGSLVHGLAPGVMRGDRKPVREPLLQLHDQRVVVRCPPTAVHVVLVNQRVMETRYRPAGRGVGAGLKNVGVQRPDEVETAIEVVGRRHGVAGNFALNFETALHGIRVHDVFRHP